MPNKPSLGYVDIDRRKEETEFRVRLQRCILIFGDWVKRDAYFGPKVYDCLRLINIDANYDVSVLDIDSHKFRDRNFPLKRQAYFLKTLRYIIYSWWHYKNKEVSAYRMNKCINYLERLANKGLGNCNVYGNIKKGWRLKVG